MPGATGIGVDVGVPVGDVEGDVAGFTVTEGRDRGQVHIVLAVGRHGVQRRERARPGWAVDVGYHEAAVPDGYPDISLHDGGSLAYLFSSSLVMSAPVRVRCASVGLLLGQPAAARGSCARPMADPQVRSSAMGSAGCKTVAGNVSVPYATPAAGTGCGNERLAGRVTLCC